MSGLHKFVTGNRNGRPESPQNGQPAVNPQRLALAAQLRIPAKSHDARPTTGAGFDERDERLIQHKATSVQQHNLQLRPSGEGRKRDPYDTDAESLNTTVNHSVVQVENSPQLDRHPQLDRQLHPGNAVSETSGDEEGSDAGSDDEAEVDEQYQFTEIQKLYLNQNGATDLSYEEQLECLSRGPPHLFPTVDGDSYPTTTDGNPTEWDEQREQPFEDPGSPSPSPQRLTGPIASAPIYNQQSLQRNQVASMPHAIPVVQQNTKIFRQGAHIRGQQRVANPELGYSQPLTTHARSSYVSHNVLNDIPQRSSRGPPVLESTRNSIPKMTEPATIAKRASVTRLEAVPTIQQPISIASVELEPVEEYQERQGDYDSEVLTNMKYDELRGESFDTNPREQGHILPEDMREKPLPERLQFAHQKLDLVDQAKFFSALPTAEWEDAGDWFLDQFTAIITRTRDARQKKRKQAQLFEETIDVRHQQVVKKRRLVDDAMAKMQAQGEGLVPRSPRVSKSPRPRRG